MPGQVAQETPTLRRLRARPPAQTRCCQPLWEQVLPILLILVLILLRSPQKETALISQTTTIVLAMKECSTTRTGKSGVPRPRPTA